MTTYQQAFDQHVVYEREPVRSEYFGYVLCLTCFALSVVQTLLWRVDDEARRFQDLSRRGCPQTQVYDREAQKTFFRGSSSLGSLEVLEAKLDLRRPSEQWWCKTS